jgi:hypothetical protein
VPPHGANHGDVVRNWASTVGIVMLSSGTSPEKEGARGVLPGYNQVADLWQRRLLDCDSPKLRVYIST